MCLGARGGVRGITKGQGTGIREQGTGSIFGQGSSLSGGWTTLFGGEFWFGVEFGPERFVFRIEAVAGLVSDSCLLFPFSRDLIFVVFCT